jgi:myo-inositol-1(or 4)-monophosphatase
MTLASTPDSISALQHPLREIVREAGSLAVSHFREGEATAARVWFKAGSSPVTEADIAVDKFLKARLSDLLPEAAWLSEETTDDPVRLGSRYVWVVDPIDGTRAFAGGHPDWCVSVALLQDGEPVLGILEAPAHAITYEAMAGSGATRNGETVMTPAQHGPVARIAGPKPLMERYARGVGRAEFLPKVPSLALRIARVSDGTLDIAFASADSHDWDIAAADLILREAGGALTAFDGATPAYNQATPRHRDMVAVASWLHPRAIRAMRA